MKLLFLNYFLLFYLISTNTSLASEKKDYAVDDISSYQSFLIYPHLDKGFTSMANGDLKLAIAEFKHAKKLASKSKMLTIYLANAYNQVKDYGKSIQILEQQNKYTPNDPQIKDALAFAKSSFEHQKLVYAQSLENKSEKLITYLKNEKPDFDNAFDENGWLELLKSNFLDDHNVILAYKPKFSYNQYTQAQDVLKILEAKGKHEDAQKLIASLPPSVSGNLKLIEYLSYQLATTNGEKEAILLLFNNYPFANGSPQIQKSLMERLGFLLSKFPNSLSEAEKNQLARPLKTIELRNLQAYILASMKDCAGLRELMSDFSSKYSADAYLNLGECYRTVAPGLAEYAFDQARLQRDDSYTKRTVGYSAFDSHDYEKSLKTWQAIPINELTNQDLISATITAITAGDLPEAKLWLDRYEKNKGAKDDQYYWLRTLILSKNDPALAIIALRKAISLKSNIMYLGQLAILEDRIGEKKASLEILNQVLAMNPSDSFVQASLGYGYYREGDLKKSREFLESAHQIRPDDEALIKQLAYTNQRLGNNADAQKYARLAVDDTNRYNPSEVNDDLEKERFGMRRMNEDLGRRWSFTVDAISGNQVSAVANSPQPGLNYQSFSQAEAAYRLGNQAIDNGKTLSAYARIFAGSGTINTSIPLYEPVLAAGLRWKPFSDQVLNLAVEQQIPLDNYQGAITTVMLRATASFFNSGVYSDDWHPVGPGWPAQNLYFDGAYYTTNRLASITADYRVSYHQKLEEGQTIEPYVHTQYNNISQATELDTRIGLGTRWNIWSGNSNYVAYPSKISIGIEVQHAFTTYLPSKNSALLTFSGKW